VRVDQAGENRCVGQVDAGGISGNLCVACGRDADDLAALDEEHLIGEQLAALHVEHMTGMNGDMCLRGGERTGEENGGEENSKFIFHAAGIVSQFARARFASRGEECLRPYIIGK
jgi:hypothetical protein